MAALLPTPVTSTLYLSNSACLTTTELASTLVSTQDTTTVPMAAPVTVAQSLARMRTGTMFAPSTSLLLESTSTSLVLTELPNIGD